MRYSSERPAKVTRLAARKSNLELLEAVGKQCGADLARGGILLVGARDHRSVAVRRAQAVLRYDRRASYFSHAALIARFREDKPALSVGLEVALDPAPGALQVPERNGVTPFKLARYLDEARYPNLALILFSLEGQREPSATSDEAIVTSATQRKDLVIDAARNPSRQREIYPLWSNLAVWARYGYDAEYVKNPLLENVPLPAASLCEYAYAAAGVDIVPGATDHQSCPELLWATALRWRQSLAGSVARMATYVVIRDEHGVPEDPLSMTIDV